MAAMAKVLTILGICLIYIAALILANPDGRYFRQATYQSEKWRPLYQAIGSQPYYGQGNNEKTISEPPQKPPPPEYRPIRRTATSSVSSYRPTFSSTSWKPVTSRPATSYRRRPGRDYQWRNDTQTKVSTLNRDYTSSEKSEPEVIPDQRRQSYRPVSADQSWNLYGSSSFSNGQSSYNGDRTRSIYGTSDNNWQNSGSVETSKDGQSYGFAQEDQRGRPYVSPARDPTQFYGYSGNKPNQPADDRSYESSTDDRIRSIETHSQKLPNGQSYGPPARDGNQGSSSFDSSYSQSSFSNQNGPKEKNYGQSFGVRKMSSGTEDNQNRDFGGAKPIDDDTSEEKNQDNPQPNVENWPSYNPQLTVKVKSSANQGMKIAVKSSNDFAFKFLKINSARTNIIFSPLSLTSSLAMLYLGARGLSAREISLVLGWEFIKDEELHSGFQKLIQLILDPNRQYDLQIANAMWVHKGFGLNDNYQKQAQSYYDANIKEGNFEFLRRKQMDEINAWVSHSTMDKIQNLLELPLPSSTVLFMANAVYFKGAWEYKFDSRQTKNDVFYNYGVNKLLTPMMSLKARLPYAYIEDLGVSAVDLPYLDPEMSMLLLVPAKRTTYRAIEAKLSTEKLDEIASQLLESDIQLQLPRFSLRERYQFEPQLYRLGMRSLLDPKKANLTGIAESSELFVSKAFHSAFIEVNEEGSEAAASTGISTGSRSGGFLTPSIVADHPFLFFIRETRTGLILFMGRVASL